jgi:hypothetical protein
MMNGENYKVNIAACKECGKEFEMRIPMRIYETMIARWESLPPALRKSRRRSTAFCGTWNFRECPHNGVSKDEVKEQ